MIYYKMKSQFYLFNKFIVQNYCLIIVLKSVSQRRKKIINKIKINGIKVETW